MKNKARQAGLKRILATAIAVVMAVSMISIPNTPAQAASGKVTSVTVTNLPAKQLTLKKGKSFTVKTKVKKTGKASTKVTYKSSNKKVATVTSKGKITAKKKGKAVITITSKANKKKTCKITVTVGTPVTKVSLNKTKATVKVGSKLTLKAKVTPKKASNTNVVWKTSNKKIATVTSKGVVKGIKAGKVKITALAKDGSGKKSVCTVTVKKKTTKKTTPTPTPTPTPTTITSMQALNSHSIQLTLSAATALSASDFAVYIKKYQSGTYKRQLAVDSVTTADNINYVITLNGDASIDEDRYVKVAIASLSAEKEAYYIQGGFTYTNEDVYSYKVNTSIDTDRSIVIKSGYADASVTGLPAGVNYKVVDNQSIEFYGTPTVTGTYTVTITAEDEIGNKEITTEKWLIYDENSIQAAADPVYKLIGSTSGAYIYRDVTARGGSGSYTYAIEGEAYNFKMDDNQLYGSFAFAGDYTINVRVTDRYNTALSALVPVEIHVKQGVTISGIVKDAEGNGVSYAGLTFTNKDDSCRYSVSGDSQTNSDGSYSVVVYPGGTYDIQVSYGNTVRYLLSQTLSATQSGYDIALPLHKVAVLSSQDSLVPTSKFGNWYDAAEEYYGYGETLYLKDGTYTLTTKGTVMSELGYSATINVTVNGAAVMTKATVTFDQQITPLSAASTQIWLPSEDNYLYYSFTPAETGQYKVALTGQYTDSTYYRFYLYSGSGYQLDTDYTYGSWTSDESGNGYYNYNAYVYENLTAGQTYYIRISSDTVMNATLSYEKDQ